MLPEAGSAKFKAMLQGIFRIIEADGLKPGDRIPSERELVCRLQAGRSTVREALRALELLGIITTRRGEGTFLQPYHSHSLIDILAFYILRDERTKDSLKEVRVILEVAAITRAVDRFTQEELENLEGIWVRMKNKVSQGGDPGDEIFDFHHHLVRAANNHLLLRIWYPVFQYAQTITGNYFLSEGQREDILGSYRSILNAIRRKDAKQAADCLQRSLSEHGWVGFSATT
ncbi:FadR family transcriptional regulator [Kroppenstedtia pulmonis]|uniref:FadR family transcriptional regulator n=1 Tax=Kroppenstedtia pulmonis TaxID=1380685 RepID=A0A7D4BEY1_9BACL|nr:FCD domain-containing protein [Kroppenstedtia pulmonis]QKG83952.1 FadR family transcriptional regulator [Kroppenstedtia pulmonis]